MKGINDDKVGWQEMERPRLVTEIFRIEGRIEALEYIISNQERHLQRLITQYKAMHTRLGALVAEERGGLLTIPDEGPDEGPDLARPSSQALIG